MNYGVLGDAHLELGDYDEAFDAFDRMMQLRPGAASYARVAYARELQGNLNGALESMRLAAEASEGGDVEAIAWYHSQVGELYLKLDKPIDAMRDSRRRRARFPAIPSPWSAMRKHSRRPVSANRRARCWRIWFENRRHPMCMPAWAISSPQKVARRRPAASTRWLKPPGGATLPSRRIWRDSSPSAAKSSTKR